MFNVADWPLCLAGHLAAFHSAFFAFSLRQGVFSWLQLLSHPCWSTKYVVLCYLRKFCLKGYYHK